MSAMGTFVIKLAACCAVAWSVTGLPMSFSYVNKEETKSLPTVRKKRSVTLSDASDSENSLDLNNSEKINELLEGKKDKLTFQDVGMKFINTNLSPKDLLMSPCQDGKYLLLRFVRNNTYKLDDERITHGSIYCPRGKLPTEYQNLKQVNLKWAKKYGHSNFLTFIQSSSCYFTKAHSKIEATDVKLNVVCKSPWGDDIVGGTLGEESYKY